ncbi:hypothetical protein TASI_0423 [Taylorella asinigenitalis MCE3]|uniref:Uncharacterized protein n=1 Tax=Taylorella asinigenitalis (strain MCE3) TaxID=1008459 RepID=G4QCR8_TAYAM|nr:hypothetical protein TASI_0423 [Taylorella asinigenitalis MCE3]
MEVIYEILRFNSSNHYGRDVLDSNLYGVSFLMREEILKKESRNFLQELMKEVPVETKEKIEKYIKDFL